MEWSSLHLRRSGARSGTATSVGKWQPLAPSSSTTSIAEIAGGGDDCEQGEGDECSSSKGNTVHEVMVVGEPSSGGQDVEVGHVDIYWSHQRMAMGVVFVEVEVLQVDP